MDEVQAVIDGRPRQEADSTSLTELDVATALDLSGRPYFVFDCPSGFGRDSVGDGHRDGAPLFRSLSDAMAITLQMKVGSGNTHHQVEALFKGFGRALRQAIRVEGSELPPARGAVMGKQNLVIIDTGCANLASVRMAFERLGVQPRVSCRPPTSSRRTN